MAIARKPNSKPKSPMDEAAADAFIAGAAKPKAEPIATEADEAGHGAEPRKSPVMLRFDRASLAKVDAAATRRGIRRRLWLQIKLSRVPYDRRHRGHDDKDKRGHYVKPQADAVSHKKTKTK